MIPKPAADRAQAGRADSRQCGTSISDDMVKRYGEVRHGIPATLVDAGARGDVERLVIAVAELDIGGELGRADRAEMLAFRRNDPDAAGGRLPDISLDVDFQAVGD